MSGKYDDIIHLPRPVSKKRAPMSRIDRAAQFSPFAALTGFDATIAETGRLTDGSIQLEEDRKQMLNETLRQILEVINRQPQVRITYFQEDDRKAGGAYVTVSGRVKKIDAFAHAIILTDRTAISIDLITDIHLEQSEQ